MECAAECADVRTWAAGLVVECHSIEVGSLEGHSSSSEHGRYTSRCFPAEGPAIFQTKQQSVAQKLKAACNNMHPTNKPRRCALQLTVLQDPILLVPALDPNALSKATISGSYQSLSAHLLAGGLVGGDQVDGLLGLGSLQQLLQGVEEASRRVHILWEVMHLHATSC